MSALTCKDSDKPHTLWYWIEDPNDPAPAPYSLLFDDRLDALDHAAAITTNPINELRWVKIFRSDNETYTCYRWNNPEPYLSPQSAALTDPSAKDLETPEFEAVWQAIKGWDIQRTPGEGYAEATGTDVMTILKALNLPKKPWYKRIFVYEGETRQNRWQLRR